MKPFRAQMVVVLFCTLILSATTSLQAASGGLQFDGSNDYVTLGQAPGLGLGQFTIETWFKRTGAGATTSTGTEGVTAVPLVTKGRGEADGSNQDMNWFLGISSTNNALTADFEEGAAGTDPGLNHPVTGVTPVALNTWYHAAVTYDGAKWQLFLNGVLETQLVVGQPPRSDSVQHAALASALTSTGAAAGYFAGILDEVRVWNYARSAAEIQTTMLQQIPVAPGLVGRWALDEAGGLTAADSSGSGINGTLTNGPLWVPGYGFVPAPTVQLVSPASQFFSTTRNVTFTVSAQDQTGLTSATLYAGKVPNSLVLSGPAESVDTYISAATPADNYGAATALNVDGDNPHAHGLIKFPNIFSLNRIPAGARISSATLKVSCTNNGALMKAYRLTQDWDENTANWTLRTATESWGNPGADGSSSHAATEVNADCTATGWRTIDITAFVQAWSDGHPNYGIVLVDTGADGVDFTTSESATPPELTVVVQADMQAVATETLSGTSATVTFNTTLEDAQTYQWNCLVANQGGESAWAPVGYTLTVDGNYPDFPVLIAPANNATEIAVTPELSATVSDPNGDTLEVVFYGRQVWADEPDFTVAVLPDTQNYSQTYPAIFTSQTQWIVNNRAARNILFVAQEGDVVNTATDQNQYVNANNSLSLLDGVLPYGLAPGNHDLPSTLFNQYFPYTRYQNNAWYGGHYPANANDSSFQLFTAGRQSFIVLHLVYRPATDVIAWADGVLKANPSRKAIIVTHAYMDTFGNRTDGSGFSTEYIWNNLVVANPNVCLVLCGHEAAEIARVDSANGRMVPQLLADYQNRANGGNGWLRLLRFAPAQNKLYVQTYSPYLDQFETDANSEFTLDLAMNEYQVVATRTAVTSGSTVTATWPGRAENTQYEWYAKATDASGRSTQSPVWKFTTGTIVTGPVPTANPQTVTATEDTALDIRLTGADPESLPLTFAVVTAPQHGTLSGTSLALVYTPATNFNGTDSFTFKANNGLADSAPATVSITVTAVNDAPVANDQVVTVPEDFPIGITLTGTDPDNGTLTSVIVNPPTFGTLVILDSGLTYTPNANYSGPDSFTFKVNDGTVDSSTPATVTITVTPVNDAPVAAAQTVSTDEDTALAVVLSGSDVEGGAISFIISAQPTHGTLSGTVPNLTYTPQANYNGPDSFAFKVNDGTSDSAPATVTVSVSPVNDAPTANHQSFSATVGAALNIALDYSDIDGDALNYAISTAPTLGTLTGTAPNLTYTPGGTAGTDTFSYTVTDGSGASASATVTIEIAAAAPITAYANGETSVMSTQVGTWADTLTDNGAYEQLTEKLSGGKPAVRFSTLEHLWTINATPGRSVTFYLQAHRSTSTDGDNFVFAYSTDGVTYQDMVTVSATEAPVGYQSFVLPPTLQGVVYVRVQDTDHTAGKTALDTLYVDHMYIESDVTRVTTPPSAPVLQQATAGNQTVTLTWTASTGANSYTVLRRTGGGTFAAIATGLAALAYVDSDLVNGTAYEYAVQAVNSFGGSEFSNILTATPQAPVVTAPPSNLTAGAAKRKINLTWTQSTTAGVTQNLIYRSANGSNYGLLATIPAATAYSDTVPTGVTYYYVVTAVGPSGESAVSNAASTTAK